MTNKINQYTNQSLYSRGPGPDLFDDGEHPRFIIVVPVRADAEVDFLRERIVFVGSGELEYAIRTHEVLYRY
jgi:hypothetical protein